MITNKKEIIHKQAEVKDLRNSNSTQLPKGAEVKDKLELWKTIKLELICTFTEREKITSIILKNVDTINNFHISSRERQRELLPIATYMDPNIS